MNLKLNFALFNVLAISQLLQKCFYRFCCIGFFSTDNPVLFLPSIWQVISKSKLESETIGHKFLYDQEVSQNELQKICVQIPYMPKPDNVES